MANIPNPWRAYSPMRRREARAGLLFVLPWLLGLLIFTAYPVLASIFIAALMADSAFGGVGERLDDLEAVLAGPADAVVVRDRAQDVGATLVREGVDFGVVTRSPAVGGQLVSIQTPRARYVAWADTFSSST